MKQPKCPCGVEFVGKYNGNMGAVAATGWTALPTHSGSFVLLCPPCAVKATKAAGELLAIVKNEHVFLPSLLRVKD